MRSRSGSTSDLFVADRPATVKAKPSPTLPQNCLCFSRGRERDKPAAEQKRAGERQRPVHGVRADHVAEGKAARHDFRAIGDHERADEHHSPAARHQAREPTLSIKVRIVMIAQIAQAFGHQGLHIGRRQPAAARMAGEIGQELP